MDNGEKVKNAAENASELQGWSPERNLASLGGRAIISSGEQPTAEAPVEEAFQIVEVTPQAPETDAPPQLVFDRSTIAPEADRLTDAEEKAISSVQDLFRRADDPGLGYANYQALRDASAGKGDE